MDEGVKDQLRSALGDLRRRSGGGDGKRDYGAVPGSRAPGRGTAHEGRGPRRWIAGDFRAGYFRRRRDALRHCAPGTLPLLVEVSPEGERTRFAGYAT